MTGAVCVLRLAVPVLLILLIAATAWWSGSRTARHEADTLRRKLDTIERIDHARDRALRLDPHAADRWLRRYSQ